MFGDNIARGKALRDDPKAARSYGKRFREFITHSWRIKLEFLGESLSVTNVTFLRYPFSPQLPPSWKPVMKPNVRRGYLPLEEQVERQVPCDDFQPIAGRALTEINILQESQSLELETKSHQSVAPHKTTI